jgi:hypothetical protein
MRETVCLPIVGVDYTTAITMLWLGGSLSALELPQKTAMPTNLAGIAVFNVL